MRIILTTVRNDACSMPDSHDAMRSLKWHKEQNFVCALVLAIVNEALEAQTP